MQLQHIFSLLFFPSEHFVGLLFFPSKLILFPDIGGAR